MYCIFCTAMLRATGITKALVPFGDGVGKNVRRFLNLHEYQAKDLMDGFGVPTQTGYTCDKPEEVNKSKC